MDEESKQDEIVTDGSEKVTLYSLFSNSTKDLYVFIVLFLLAYYVVHIFTIIPKKAQYLLDAESKSVKPLLVDISDIKEHRFKEISWHGLPIGIYKRTEIDFETINKRHPIQIKSSINEELNQQLEIYSLEDEAGTLNKGLRSIKGEYFVFIMLSPFKGCPLKVIFYHDANDRNKGQYANIYATCTLQTYDMNGKLSLENFYGYDQFKSKLYTNYLLIPNHRFIDNNTIEFYPNNQETIE